MKIGIATFYRECHPGGVLQAYALSRALAGLGHEPFFIAYDRPVDSSGMRGLRGRLAGLLDQRARTIRGFAAFRSAFLDETARVYRSHEELRADPPMAEAYLCGSDQIWNPSLLAGKQFDPAYFLQFGDPTIRRISYAASLGGHRPSPAELRGLQNYLGGFRSISVREPSARAILAPSLGREVALTVDPTLLLDDYAELVGRETGGGDYVLLYALNQTSGMEALVRAVSRRLDVRILVAGGPVLPWRRIGKRVEFRSPMEWLRLIHGAAAVVTDSYHGVVFSLLFRRPVRFFHLTGALESRNERIEHLCEILGVGDAVLGKSVDGGEAVGVDWEDLARRLGVLRTQSRSFLNRALEA